MTRERVSSTGDKLPAWMSRHRAMLLRLGLGVGVGLLAAGVVRRHDQLRQGDPELEAHLTRLFAEEGDSQKERVALGLPPRVAPLPATRSTENKIALLSTDKARLLAQLRSVDGRPAVGWRQQDGEWITAESETTLQTAEPKRIGGVEVSRSRSLAAVWLGRYAAEAAIGVSYTGENDVRLFHPLDTSLEQTAHLREMQDRMLSGVPVLRPQASPTSGHNE